jgi:hypothetical protein
MVQYTMSNCARYTLGARYLYFKRNAEIQCTVTKLSFIQVDT